MNELILNKETMSSLQIAEITGKQHSHIMRDIRTMLDQGASASNFGLGSYSDANGQNRPCYNITNKGCLILASGYDVKLREAIIDRWEELEKEKISSMPAIPKTFAEALQLAADQARMLEVQNQQILELQPKATYYDKVLSSPDAVTVSILAKDYGMSAVAFNKLLHDLKIQYKQADTWLLYQKYASMGYTKTQTTAYDKGDNVQGVSVLTKWTQKGRLFLYDLLKQNGVLPLIEKELIN